MPRISVIVPARDVAAYVGPCLDDLRRQSFKDFEAIVVDDGSTDGTREVVERIADEDHRFVLLDGPGRGPGAARNLALDRAVGDELAFMDADDRISRRMLERLHTEMTRTDADLVVSNVRRLRGVETSVSGLHAQALGGPAGTTRLIERPELVYDTTLWNKLARRSLWEQAGIRFSEDCWSEDLVPTLREHVASSRTHVLTEVLYYWRVREDPATSITDRKYVDPEARLQALRDRLGALGEARRMLLRELGDDRVLGAFDERMLWRDLRSYLAFHPEADDGYRSSLMQWCGEHLQVHEVDPSRFQLGLLLEAAYTSLLAGDQDRLARLLDPGVRETVEVSGDRLLVRVRPPTEARRWSRLLPGHPRDLAVREDALERMRVESRLDDITLDPRGTDDLTVSGRVRVRDGHVDLEAPWRVALHLEGRSTGRTVTGTAVPAGRLPDHRTHPLLGNGWRTFTTTVDPALLANFPEEDGWRLRLRVELHAAAVTTAPRCSSEAARSLGRGRAVEHDADLVPLAAASSRLLLRRLDTPARLRSATDLGGGRVQLELEGSAPDAEVWLQTERGERVATAEMSGDDAEMLADLALGELRVGPPLELWCATGGVQAPVRAAADARSVWLPALVVDANDRLGVLAVGPTGAIRLEARLPWLEVTGVSVGTAPAGPSIALWGRSPQQFDAGVGELEAYCRWTEARVRAPVQVDADEWRAILPVDEMTGHFDGGLVSRRWALRFVDPLSRRRALRPPPGELHRFPLSVVADGVEGRVELDAAGRARLRVGPNTGDS